MLEIVEEVEHGELREAPLPSRAAVARWLVLRVAIGALLTSVLGFAGRWFWLFDLCNHFRFQCALVLFVTTVCLLLLRCWRWAGVSLMGVALNAAFVLPLYLGSPGQIALDQPTLTVMHFNVNTANRDHAGVISEIQSHAPDLLFVQEVSPAWIGALSSGLDRYEQVASEPRADNFGIACFVRVDANGTRTIGIEQASTYDMTNGIAGVPVIELKCVHAGKTVSILSIHPLPPIGLAYARVRDEVLEEAGQWAAKQDGPSIVVGDFNATPWSTAFRDMQSAGRLINSQIGFGQAPTWPAGLGSLGMIPIDHLLHSEELATGSRVIGKAAGSDHRPLVVELGWRQ